MTAIRTVTRLAIVGVALGACSSDGGDETDPGGIYADASVAELTTQVLEQVGRHVAAETDAFVIAATALSEATTAFETALDDDTRTAAQAAWHDAMMIWQRLEVMQFGPAGAMDASVGGGDLRDEIYSWPVDNPCRVDQETASVGYAAEGFADLPPNVRGLDALEYLLFVDGHENDCAPNSGINRDGTWAALDSAEIDQRRAAYAAIVSVDLLDDARSLAAEWAAGGAFRTEFVAAGDASTLFPTRREALNGLSDAMFYVDTEVKDMKLARPAGLAGCADVVCPDEVESFWSQRSLANIQANLDAFSALYHGGPRGGDEPGFHELLLALGADEIAGSMDEAIAAAIETTDRGGDGLAPHVESDLAYVIEVYEAVKAITDLLKTQFVGTLDLETPDRAAGDND